MSAHCIITPTDIHLAGIVHQMACDQSRGPHDSWGMLSQDPHLAGPAAHAPSPEAHLQVSPPLPAGGPMPFNCVQTLSVVNFLKRSRQKLLSIK